MSRHLRKAGLKTRTTPTAGLKTCTTPCLRRISARLCHAASTAAMKGTLGYGASTCSYADWLHADLIVLFGSNVANNQPVTTKYLHYAKENGAQIAMVNTYREPGMQRYWVPS